MMANGLEFASIYRRLGIEGLHERGESYYQTRMKAVVEELTGKGLVQNNRWGIVINIVGRGR
jgi:hypothetical protein